MCEDNIVCVKAHLYFIGFYMYMIKTILIQLSWVADSFLFLKETYTLVERLEKRILQKQLSTS